MSDLGFSEHFGMLEEGKSHDFVKALHGATRYLTIAAQTPWIRPVMWMFPIDNKSLEDGKKFGQISKATYDRRRASEKRQGDMYEYISAKGDGPRPLTEFELIADTSRKWLNQDTNPSDTDDSSDHCCRRCIYGVVSDVHLPIYLS